MPKLFRLVSHFSRETFSRTLREVRILRSMSKQQLADKIGKTRQQIVRYENVEYNKQFPPLDVFVKICIALQIRPSDLLYIEQVDVNDFPEESIIYEWELKIDRIYWTCPQCKGLNISYGNFEGGMDKVRGIVTFMCEHCNNYFEKLCEEKSE